MKKRLPGSHKINDMKKLRTNCHQKLFGVHVFESTNKWLTVNWGLTQHFQNIALRTSKPTTSQPHNLAWALISSIIVSSIVKVIKGHLISSEMTKRSSLDNVYKTIQHMVAAWLSHNVIGHIKEVALRRARLVLGWVTVSGFISRCWNLYFGI